MARPAPESAPQNAARDAPGKAARSAPGKAPPARAGVRLFGVLAAATGLAVLVLVLSAGGGAPAPAPPGIPDPGPVTGWGLPVTRLFADAFGVLTVGLLLVAAVLLPAPERRLGGTALRATRAAALAAACWALAAAVEIVFTLSDLLGVPARGALDSTQLYSFVTDVAQGRALLVQAVLAGLLAVVAPWLLGRRGAVVLWLTAVAALAPPALAGHSASESDHTLATSSLLVHLLAAATWVGGLVALLWLAVRFRRPVRPDAPPPAPLAAAVPRFSTLAAWCVAAVAVSGVVNAALRLDPPSTLVTSAYGRLVVAKTAALVLLAAAGYAHRRRSLPALTAVGGHAGPRSAFRVVFVRLAAVEVLLMTATLGLAVGLSRTPTPVPRSASLSGASPARIVLGYDLPAPPTAARLLADARPDGFALTFVVLAAAVYLSGWRTLRRRGDAWPAGRTCAWLGGLAVLAFTTSGGVGRYAPVLFSVHMAQHMVLNMIVPLLLVLGAPVTLALRALPASGSGGEAGPRQTLLAVLHSAPVRVVSHPLVAAALFASSLYALYFTPLFAAVMASHWGHLAMQAHFVAAGGVFFWTLIGIDPGPRRPPHLLRVLLLFVVMAVHAFFSLAVMSSGEVFAADYYRSLHRTWSTDLLADQRLGGAIGWGFGDIPILLVLTALFVQWIRADERAARAADRAADRGGAGDPLAQYNAYLAALHGRDSNNDT